MHLLKALRVPKHEPCASIADDDLVGSGVIGRAPTLIGLRCVLERLYMGREWQGAQGG